MLAENHNYNSNCSPPTRARDTTVQPISVGTINVYNYLIRNRAVRFEFSVDFSCKFELKIHKILAR